MKTTNKIILMTILLNVSLGIYAQSPLWLVGSNYYDQNLIPFYLPTGPNSTIDYAGQQAQYAANAMYNPIDGSLLFFVVDGVVYDHEGYYLGSLNEANDPQNNMLSMRGVSEISIVPDPADCARYYIIGSRRLPNEDNVGFSPDDFPSSADRDITHEIDCELFMGVVNMSLTRLVDNPGRQGALEHPDPSLGSYIVSLRSLIPANQKFTSSQVIDYAGIEQIAISPKSDDNTHTLFYKDRYACLYAFTIDNNGINYVNNSVIDTRTGLYPVFSPSNTNYIYPTRSELEVMELPNGNFRIIGTSYNSVNIGGAWQSKNKVFRMDYASSGSPVASSYLEYQHFTNAPFSSPRIKGLEISPNQQYVYFTSINNAAFPRSLYCLDMNTFQLVALPNISNAQSLNFKNSMIERANDGTANGKVILGNAGGLHALSDPNNPASTTLNQIINASLDLTMLNYPPLSNPPSVWVETLGMYLLPDQMDFDANCQIGCYDLTWGPSNPDISCCHLYSSLSSEVSSFVNDIIISQSTTWQPGASIGSQTIPASGDLKILGNVIIEPGATLTINDMTIEFGPESKILVNRGISPSSLGAELRVFRSTLTALNGCGGFNMWQGIEAHGYHTTSQFSNGHARVNILDNSVIEYAYFGVRSGSLEFSDRGGAKVWGKNSTFLNNYYDVYFHPMNNLGTLSSMSNCNFVTDDNLKSELISSQPVHIYLDFLRNFGVSSCKFINETTISEENLQRGIGVWSNGAHFKVYTNYTGVANKFEGLQYGVRAYQSFGSRNIEVYDAIFNNNIYGVYGSSGQKNRILRNTFTVFNTSVFNSPIGITSGVHLRGCTAYEVRDNFFNSSSPAEKNVNVIGCIVDHSGPFANEIYDNTFDGLHTGGLTMRQNCTAPGMKPVGLRWVCNTFLNQAKNNLWIYPHATLHPTQGGLASGEASGNVFNTNPDFDINHEGSQNPIRYMHQPTPNHTPQFINGNVILIPANTNGCDDFSGFNGEITTNNFQSVRQALVDERDSVLATIDYGSTDSVVLEILDPYLSPLQKRELLTQENMTISDEVLIRYINSNPIHADLFYVLTFNSPLSDVVLQEMMDVSTLPLGMQQQILLLAQGFTESDIKMSIIQDYTLKIPAVERDYLSYVLADSTNLDPYGELILVYENEVEHNFDVLDNLFNLYVADGNVAKADSVNTLVKALADDNSYAFLNDLAVASMTTDMFTLLEDSTTILTLEMIADQHDYRDGMRAQSILSGYLGYEFDAVFKGNKNMGVTRELTLPSSSNDVSLFPNPAEDYFFVVRNETGQIDASRKANIYNLSGILVQSIDFAANNLSLEISTKTWDHGFYLVEVIENGVSISTKRVLVR